MTPLASYEYIERDNIKIRISWVTRWGTFHHGSSGIWDVGLNLKEKYLVYQMTTSSLEVAHKELKETVSYWLKTAIPADQVVVSGGGAKKLLPQEQPFWVLFMGNSLYDINDSKGLAL